jgi:hypothetical protein
MPGNSRTSDYLILIGLGLTMGLCLLGLYAWGALNQAANEPGVRTTHSANVDGTMVASILFERLQAPLQPMEDLLLPESLAGVGVLWVIDPLIPLNSAEIRAVEKWVYDGGVLVTTGMPGQLFAGSGGADTAGRRGAASCRASAATHRGLESADPIPPSARGLPLARGISALQWASGNTLRFDERGVFRPLLGDDQGVRIAGRHFGRGSAILLADSSFLANGMIGRHDNAVLAVNLNRYAVSRSNGGRCVYDEHHLGFGRYESSLEALAWILVTTSPGWAVLSLTVAGLLFLLYKGRRFGTRQAPGRARRRSKMEFVQAVGASMRAAGAHRLAWTLVYGGWKRDACRDLGLPACAPAPEIAAGLARRTGKPVVDCQALLDGCEQAGRSDRLPARRLAELVDNLARLDRGLPNADRRGQSNR